MLNHLTKLRKAGQRTLCALLLAGCAFFPGNADAADETKDKAQAKIEQPKKEKSDSSGEKLYKMVVSRRELERNPSIMNILTYKKNQDEYFCLPSQLFDFDGY